MVRDSLTRIEETTRLHLLRARDTMCDMERDTMCDMEMAVTLPATFVTPDSALRPPAGSSIPQWLQLIRAEYVEIPGLSLTEAQVRRLWSLDALTAEALLRALLDVGFLRRTHRGSYVRGDRD